MKLFRHAILAGVLVAGALPAPALELGEGFGVTVRMSANVRSRAADSSDATVSVDIEKPDGTFATISTASGGGPNQKYVLPVTTVSLEPGRTYDVRVFTHRTNFVELVAAPPPGYEIRWGGQLGRKFMVSTPDPDGLGYYDEPQSLQVVAAAASIPPSRAGTAQSLSNGAAHWRVSLGSLPNGSSAGYLELLESGRNASGFGDVFNLYTGVQYIAPSDDVQQYQGAAGRQIVAYETGVNIIPYGSGYQIKFYNRGQVVDNGTSASPRFSYTGDPYVSYLVEPNGSTTSIRISCETRQLPNLTTAGISPARTSVTTLSRTGTWPAYTWTRDDWTTSGVAALSRDTRTWASGNGTLDHGETVNVRKPGDTINASYATRTYLNKSWGEAVSSETRGSSSAITTEYAYYEASSDPGSFTYPKLVTVTGGGWQAFEYYPAQFTGDPLTDTGSRTGVPRRIHRPFNNTTAPAPSDDLSTRTSGEILSFEYSDDAFTQVWGQAIRPTLAQSAVYGAAVITAKSATTYADTTLTIGAQTLPLVTATRSDYPSSTGTALVTTTKYFREDTYDAFFRTQPHSITRPDGTRDAYAYEKGTLSGTTFTPAYTGAASRVTVIHGVTDSSKGSVPTALTYYPTDTVYVVDKKSTKDVVLRDSYARVSRIEQYVWNATAWSLVSAVDLSYDYANQITSRTLANGGIEESPYTGDQKQYDRDAGGVTINYAYDDAGRMLRAEKASATYTDALANTPLTIATLTTQFTYDAENRLTLQQSGTFANNQFSGETLSRSWAYDDAGRLTSQSDPGPNGAMTTGYAYTPLSRLVTISLPNGGSRSETLQPDGALQEVTGNGVVPAYFTYSIESGGGRRTRVDFGSRNASRTQATVVDWLGRTTLTSRPGFTGQDAFEEAATYDPNKGRLTKRTRTGYAPTLYEYDALSQVTRTGLDLSSPANDALDDSSKDRITETDRSFEYTGGAWWLTETEKVYPTADSSATLTVSIARQRLSGFGAAYGGFGALRAEVQTSDVDGNLTKVQTYVDREAKTTKVVTTLPGVTNAQVETAVNGLGTSVLRVDGLTYTSTYDGLHRSSTQTDPRTGSVTTTYKTGSMFVYRVSAPITPGGTYGYAATYAYRNAGQVTEAIDANQKSSRTEYNYLDQIVHRWGDAVQPVEYGYNTLGERETMRTYRQGSNWNAITWALTTPGTADTTTWHYDGPSGLLDSKSDPINPATRYTYNRRGQLDVRTWSRGTTSTYGYDAATGELTGITYNDGTPAVSFTYTRGGVLKTATDGGGERTFNYGTATGSHALQLDSLDLPGYYNSRRVTRQYDSIKRPAGFKLGTASSAGADLTQTLAYNSAGRFDHVDTSSSVEGTRTFTYSYYAFGTQGLTAPFVGGYSAGGLTVTRGYEAKRNLLTSIDSTWNGTSRSRFDYVHTPLAQRYTAKQSGDAFADYGGSIYRRYVYGDRGELTSGADYLGETPTPLGGTPDANAQLPSRNFSYVLDNAGNRSSSSRSGTSGLDTYEMDDAHARLNQYWKLKNNYARASGTVSANTSSVAVSSPGLGWVVGKRQRFWAADAQVQTDASPAYLPLTVTATWTNGAGAGVDLVRTDTSRTLVLRPQSQTLSYDADGNLTDDGVWRYTYDAENRVTAIETNPTIISFLTPANARRLEFDYDYLNRRVQKLVRAGWNGSRYTTVLFQRRYVYDGDNVIAELSGDGANVVRSFTWGLDLTGSLTASGGVGALLQLTDHAGSTSYLPTYDGNGNVVALLRAADGVAVARYEYSPFGELLRCEGGVAAGNPFRFSTKFSDDETGLLYYGARYYSPGMGRFINRDPIAEQGGLNLYGFCGNDGVNRFDVLGNGNFFSDLWNGTVGALGKGLKRLERWTRTHTPGAILLNVAAAIFAPWALPVTGPLALASEARQAWHFAQQNPQIAAVVAAIATWYIGGWGASAMGFAYGSATNVVIAGASSGFAGGFVGARASGADLSTAFRAGYQGAAWGGGLAFVGSQIGMKPSTKFAWRDAASQFVNAEARYEVSRFAENKLGISGWEFDAYLTATSFIGNGLFGDRIKEGVDEKTGTKFKWISGILSRNRDEAVIKNGALNAVFGLPFDAVDIVLGYQGLPSATGWEIIADKSLQAAILKSHSLGTLDMKTQTLLGTLQHGSMFSLPFGNISPEGVALTLGTNDPVNGFMLGKLLNPWATTTSLDPQFLGMAHTNYPGTGF